VSSSPILRGLYVYPVKSCAGIALTEVHLGATGLVHDREWMVVDPSGRFITQRDTPALARVVTALTDTHLQLSTPDGARVAVPLGHEGELSTVGVWRSRVPAFDAGAAASEFFSCWLQRPARLVRFDARHRRLSNRDWTGGLAAPNLFSDGYPLLVLSEASRLDLSARVGRDLPLDRFRANLMLDGVPAYAEDHAAELHLDAGVVLRLTKPCTRCIMTTIDQTTGLPDGDEPLRTLKTYKYDAALRGVTFGRNAVLLPGAAGAMLRCGQSLSLKPV
jgi:hypothetical protein